MRERDIQAAMAIPGRFKPDGCWTPVLGGKTGTQVVGYFQNNRKHRRAEAAKARRARR